MEHIVSVPSILSIDEFITIRNLLRCIKNGLSIHSCEGIVSDNHQWKFGCFQFLTNCMISWINWFEDACTTAEMSIGIGEISRSSNIINFGLLLINCLQDAWIEYWRLSPRIDSNKEDEISILNSLNLRVEQVVWSKVVVEVKRPVLSELVVEGVEWVEEIFQCLDILHTLELSNSTRHIFPFHLINPRSNHGESVFPTLFCEISPFPKKRNS